MEIRQVITGTAHGRPAFTHDEAVQAVSPRFFPPPGGMRAVAWTAPPASGFADDAAAEEDRERTDELVPGAAGLEISTDGMHATATLDFKSVAPFHGPEGA